MPFAGFSLSSLWARQTASDGSAVPGTEETPATREIHSEPSWLVKSSTSLIGARFSELGSLGGSSIAASVGAGLYLIGIWPFSCNLVCLYAISSFIIRRCLFAVVLF
jgi:hypothetical protein